MGPTCNDVSILWLKYICNYKIYFNRNNRFFISSKYETLEQKYERLKNIILKAKELKSKNDKDDSKE